jgi:invasion protein IalB
MRRENFYWSLIVLLAIHNSIAAAEAPASGKASGQTFAQSGPSKSIKTETSAYDAWSVRCDYFKDAPRPKCGARIAVQRSGTRDVMIVLAVVDAQNGEKRLLIDIPSYVSVSGGISLSVGGGAPLRVGIESCQPALCTGVLPLSGALLAKLQEEGKATVAWTSTAVGPIKVDFELKGGRKALAVLAEK